MKKTSKEKIPVALIKEKIDIDKYGDYRYGLCDAEIEEYILNRVLHSKKKKFKTMTKQELMKMFNEIAGVNTCALTSTGVILMYRHDVQRFADQMFLGTPTYWD